MALFRSSLHRDMWQMRWCHTCFQPDEAARRIQGRDTICPIWEKALRTDRKPPQWDRNTRAEEMERTIKCNEYAPTPPVTRRNKAVAEDVPMFDIEPHTVRLVPVDGWPDRPSSKNEVDHQ